MSVRDTDKGWREFFERMEREAGRSSVKVGILGDSDRGGLHQVDPATGRAEELTVAEIAVVNEFGTENGEIPSRPAHRMTFDRRQGEIELEARGALEAVLDGKITTREALGLMGAKHAAEIKNTITEGAGVPPPNAPSTAAAKERAGEWNKGSAAAELGPRPLVDTGATVAAISYAVEDEGAEVGPPKYVSSK